MTRQRPSAVTVQVVESRGHTAFQATVDLAVPIPLTVARATDPVFIAARSRARDTARRALRRELTAEGYKIEHPVPVIYEAAVLNAADAVYRFVFTEKE